MFKTFNSKENFNRPDGQSKNHDQTLPATGAGRRGHFLFLAHYVVSAKSNSHFPWLGLGLGIHLFVKVPRPGAAKGPLRSSSQAATCYY